MQMRAGTAMLMCAALVLGAPSHLAAFQEPGTSYGDRVGEKLRAGVRSVVTFPLPVAEGVLEGLDDFPGPGLVLKPIGGVACAIGFAVTGVYDVVTFMIPAGMVDLTTGSLCDFER